VVSGATRALIQAATALFVDLLACAPDDPYDDGQWCNSTTDPMRATLPLAGECREWRKWIPQRHRDPDEPREDPHVFPKAPGSPHGPVEHAVGLYGTGMAGRRGAATAAALAHRRHRSRGPPARRGGSTASAVSGRARQYRTAPTRTRRHRPAQARSSFSSATSTPPATRAHLALQTAPAIGSPRPSRRLLRSASLHGSHTCTKVASTP
jgi:hypothetical protein